MSLITNPFDEDPFDKVVNTESLVSSEGRSSGVRDGSRTGLSRGHGMGLLLGAELGAELGFMRGVVLCCMDTSRESASSHDGDPSLSGSGCDAPQDRNTRLEKLSAEVVRLIDEFPLNNPSDASGIERVRARFKQFAALARLPHASRSLSSTPPQEVY